MPDILIYDDIGESWFSEESITAKTIKPQLQGDLTVRIDSPGGDVFAGFAIYNLLKQHEGNVDVYIDGLAASAASIIAMAGDNIYMSETSMMMIHDPWTIALGGSEDMQKTADLLDKIKDSIIPAYTSVTGIGEDEVAAMMKEETWMTGAEASEKGFATLIEFEGATIKNKTRPWIQNAPAFKTLLDEINNKLEGESCHWKRSLANKRLSLIE